MKNKILLFTLILTKFILGQNIPPQIISEGNELYCPLSEQTIVTNFDIIDPDDISVDAFYIQISEGYIFGEDSLTLTGNHPDVIASWDAVEGKLELLGPPGQSLLYTNIISAVYDVMFFSNNEDLIDKTFSFTIGDANYLESTGHYYEFIPLIDVRWTEAKVLAEGLTYYGLQGYLATLTSEAENQIAAVQTNNFGWIGASDLANEGDWRWVTGPEGLENGGAGRSFWLGNGASLGGAAVNGEYSNWNGTNEPNNAGPEHYAHVTSPNVGGIGTWNDLPDPAAGGGDYQSKGYFVEYGGMPGDPDLELSSSTKLLAPQISININFFGCSNDNLSILAESNSESGEVYFYDSLDSPVPIFIGNEFSPDVSGFFDVVTYYITPFPPGICEFPRTEVPVLVFASPIANQPEDLVICNDNLVTNLDFVAAQTQVLAEQDPTQFIVSYHLSQDDADTNSGALSLPYQNTNSSEEIFVRVSNLFNPACYDTTSFTLTVFEAPVANIVETFEICDDGDDGDDANGQAEVTLTDFDAIVLDTQDSTLFSVSYHLSQGDADANTAALTSPYYNAGAAFTYPVFARIQNNLNTDCYATTEFTVNIYKTPTANLADDIDICDDDNDGVMSFDFVAPQTQVLAEQDPTEFTVSYHLSQDDADTNSGALSLPYQNTNSSEEIFVRIENNANTACYDTTSFIINIFNTPVIPQGIQYNLCDYTNPGDLTEVFDLLSLNAEIINGQDVTISHHLSFEDAENGVGAITDPYTNTSPNQVIFVLLENNAYTGCRSIGTYNIIVDPLPDLITNVPLVQCDIDDIQDGISIYNLEEAAENIIIGDDANNYTLSFHLSQEDLDANIGAIADPTNFVNTSPLQTIFTRVENIATTCYSTSFFYLETIFNPIPGDAGLIVCDNSEMNGNDYDGLGLFTLSDANEYILSLIVANPNNDITDADQLDVAYYSSETDALLELGQLPDQYISEVADSQTVFVRIERGNDCFGINTMLLEVIPVPELNEIPDEILCSDNPGIAEVFLTDYDAIVLGSQSANDVIISYHATQQDADLGIGALASPYTVTNQQTIFVREEVQNNDPNQTGCYITNVNFTLTVEPNPSVNIPTPQVLCDDDFDGLQTFDLNGVDIEIIGGQTDMVVSYYTNQNDADSASNPVGDVFQTTQEDTQTLIFRIENITTGCYSTGNLELIVNPLPVLQPLDNFAACDDNVETDNDTSNDSVEFDLLSQNTAVLNGQDPTIFEVSYHLSQIDADQGINALVSPYTNTSNPQTIFTRVRNTLTDCFNTVPLVLQVNPLPVVNLDEDYLLCVNTNGTEILDPLVIYSNLSATDFSFIWSNANGDVLGTDPDFEPTQGGVYNLEVFDALLPTQCAAPVETFIVIESSPPDVTAEVTSEPFASTHVIQSTGTGQGIYEFSLDQGPWGDSGLFVGVKPGEHIVSVRDLNGCGTVSVPLLVIDYPKFFTPNQDGYNDTWNITALENQPNSKIYIFDRYGKFIKQISTSGIGWDGTYNGAQMPSTDYWFKLEYTDLDTGNLKIFKAHFSLKR